jgi:squalene cyclase
MEKEILENRLRSLYNSLAEEQNTLGFWSGRLSSSALSTSIAIISLKISGRKEFEEQINSGYNWLVNNINTDGGYGDTPESESNVSTSLICYAAVNFCQCHNKGGSLLNAIEKFLATKHITFDSQDITSAILAFYGRDYTFSVPILSLLIICGVLPGKAVSHIPQLPFELSLLPPAWYRFFNMQVVSYAIPALIGVGIFTHSSSKKGNSVTKLYRNRCIGPSITKLTSLMPESGGFLEAIPLTGFVCMCLTASGNSRNEVVKKGIAFLEKQQREDGSWPIDTDLSTWVTTLIIKAIGPQIKSVLPAEKLKLLKTHLLDIQYKTKHPFNGSKSGGWGWTNFTGSVPDADDTPGAILSLLALYDGGQQEMEAIINGCCWLTGIQNFDGGFPAFCKGWGRLPFDSSCADLTGHALLALISVLDKTDINIPDKLSRKISRSTARAAGYLKKNQAADGSWLPLWFGNQMTGDKKNPVYGTGRVAVYLGECMGKKYLKGELRESISHMVSSAQQYLLTQQNSDGSWGGKKGIAGTIEETSLAISALTSTNREACMSGFEWLIKEEGLNNLHPSPIGLYFAALWYDEKMYPVVFYTEALRRFIFEENNRSDPDNQLPV